MTFPHGKYKTVYADPPWPEYGGGAVYRRGANRHYDLMTLTQIADLPISDLAHSAGCHLYLWVTNTYLPAALEIVVGWGFKYVTTITWGKDRFGLGQYYRGASEHCIFARKGVSPRIELFARPPFAKGWIAWGEDTKGD